jgi:hypothetical protein
VLCVVCCVLCVVCCGCGVFTKVIQSPTSTAEIAGVFSSLSSTLGPIERRLVGVGFTFLRGLMRKVEVVAMAVGDGVGDEVGDIFNSIEEETEV